MVVSCPKRMASRTCCCTVSVISCTAVWGDEVLVGTGGSLLWCLSSGTAFVAANYTLQPITMSSGAGGTLLLIPTCPTGRPALELTTSVSLTDDDLARLAALAGRGGISQS